MGSVLAVGDWEVTVDRVEIAESLSSYDGDEFIKPVGRFALVFMTATNRGLRPESLFMDDARIVDAEGDSFRPDGIGSIYASSLDCDIAAFRVNPDASACMVTAFDISEQSSFYVFLIGTERTLLVVP
jgi:hypothetical protein